MPADIKYAIRSLLISDPTVFGLLGTRVYPVTLPPTKTYPLASLQIVSNTPTSSHSGSSKFTTDRVQLTIWTDTDQQGVTLRNECKRVLQDFRGSVTIGSDTVRIDRIAWQNDLELEDPELQKQYRPIDLLCWHNTPT